MSKMIQIRNVADDVHREAKARAARERPSLGEDPAAAVRAERRSR